jgi:hypothetical protein
VTGHPLRTEREDAVGIDLLHDPTHLISAGRIQSRVHVDVDRPFEEVVLLHPEDVQTPQELVGPNVAHRGGRPLLVVHRAALPAGGRHVHDPLSGLHGGRHQTGAQVDVVVRMCPDAEDGPERRRVTHAGGC